MSEVNGDDIERLASRLAMMVSEEGEAANAGRAVAQLARRLGLTGGALKEMFLYGAMPGVARPAPPPSTAELDKLEREVSVLRKSMRVLEANNRDLEHQREVMIRQIEGMRSRVATADSRSQIGFILFGVVLLAAAGAGAVSWLMALRETDRPVPITAVAPSSSSIVIAGPDRSAINTAETLDYGPVLRRVGVIRPGRAVARREPKEAAAALATLQEGAPVVVRRVFSIGRVQWAEVEIGSSFGFMVASEIDLGYGATEPS